MTSEISTGVANTNGSGQGGGWPFATQILPSARCHSTSLEGLLIVGDAATEGVLEGCAIGLAVGFGVYAGEAGRDAGAQAASKITRMSKLWKF